MIGKTILHYKILEKLGEGGMGVVYKAEDTKLERTVAIKLLPAHLLTSKDDRARFNREAKAAAALNHPNIATVYEINEYEGKPFIVMEYVEGKTLNDVLEKELFKLKDAISIAIQVAEGLKAAHAKNIVHRDIKSGNVLVSKDGQAKILDFGLAKTAMSTKLTKMGSTLGTVAYMSPEQISTQSVDHRTDLWSLGVVIFEMLTGRFPFSGEYDQAIFYNILNEPPEPLTAIRSGIPISLEWIVNKLLAKNPDERYQNANDLIIDLKAVDLTDSGFSRISTTSTHTIKQKAFPQKTNRERFIWSGLVVILSTLLILLSQRGEQKGQNSQVLRFGVDITDDGELANTGIPLDISLDGSKIVYSVGQEGLYLRYANDLLNSIFIQGTENATNPAFSPDGNWIAFYEGGDIKKVSLLGGKPQIILDTGDESNKTYQHWYADNNLIFIQQYHDGVFQISAAGGIPKKLNETDSLSEFFDDPQVLPDGKNILIRRKIKKEEVRKIEVFNLESGEFTPLINSSGHSRYIPNGHIIYGWNGDLWIVPFDVNKLKITGQAVPVVSNVRTKSNGTSLYAVSENGMLVYPQGESFEKGEAEKGYLEIKQLSGNSEILTFPGGTAGASISPDGRFCAFSVQEEKWNLWIYDLKMKISRRLTDNEGSDGGVSWSPDGKTLYFLSTRFNGNINVATMPFDGSKQPELLLEGGKRDEYPMLSPDGKNLVFVMNNNDNDDIFIWPLDGSQKPKPYLQTAKNEGSPAISPDGKWIAYTSDESGLSEVYVGPFPGPAGFRKISVDGGIEPCWAPDGKTLYFRTEKGKKLYQVSFQSGAELKIGSPQLLFENNDWIADAPFRQYDISPNGKFFILIRTNERETKTVQAERRLIVVQNWFEELKTKITPIEKNADW
jgi:serine/threonine protein kinase